MAIKKSPDHLPGSIDPAERAARLRYQGFS